jgi:hypothetical protein
LRESQPLGGRCNSMRSVRLCAEGLIINGAFSSQLPAGKGGSCLAVDEWTVQAKVYTIITKRDNNSNDNKDMIYESYEMTQIWPIPCVQ